MARHPKNKQAKLESLVTKGNLDSCQRFFFSNPAARDPML